MFRAGFVCFWSFPLGQVDPELFRRYAACTWLLLFSLLNIVMLTVWFFPYAGGFSSFQNYSGGGVLIIFLCSIP